MRRRNILAMAGVTVLLPLAALAQGAGGAGPGSYEGPQYGGNNGQAAKSGTTPTRVKPGADGNEPTRDLGTETSRNTTTSSADRATDPDDAATDGARSSRHRYARRHAKTGERSGSATPADETPPH